MTPRHLLERNEYMFTQILYRGQHCPVILQNDNMKKKRRDPCSMFSRPFQETQPHTCESRRRVVLQTARDLYCSERNAPQLCHGYSDTQDAIGIVVSKQVKVKILANKSNIHIEHIKQSKSRDVLLNKCRKMFKK